MIAAIVVSGGAEKRDKALALGASHVIARDADWPAEVKRLTEERDILKKAAAYFAKG